MNAWRWSLVLNLAALGLQVVETTAELEKHRNLKADYLLLRSGEACSRCDAIEKTMLALDRHVKLPMLVSKFDSNLDPRLEYHRWLSDSGFETGGVYVEELYSGQMTLGSILKFLEKKIGHITEAASIQEAVQRSHKNSRVPFVGTFQDENCAGMAVLKEVAKTIKQDPLMKTIDFYYVIDPAAVKTTMGELCVSHPDEMRLVAPIPSVGFVIDWVRAESIPQFGRLSREGILRRRERSRWLVLLGDEKTYELYQHEFRLFSMFHREDWATGFLLRAEAAEANLKKVLNVEEDLTALLAADCPVECVVRRAENLIQIFPITAGLDEKRLSALAQLRPAEKPTSEGPTSEGPTSEGPTSPLHHDLGAEHAAWSQSTIHRVSKEEFSRKVLQTYEPLLLLLHEPEELLSQELKAVFQNVAESLQMKGIKFYEMTQLPPPHPQYVPPSYPHLWFKGYGQQTPPLAIPWQEAAETKGGQPEGGQPEGGQPKGGQPKGGPTKGGWKFGTALNALVSQSLTRVREVIDRILKNLNSTNEL